jgi:hypothetical protein
MQIEPGIYFVFARIISPFESFCFGIPTHNNRCVTKKECYGKPFKQAQNETIHSICSSVTKQFVTT